MKLVVVTRLRNEDDIVEDFVRHHAALADRLVLLDDGSTDRSMEILAALKREGLPLSVYTVRSARSVESEHCTFLFRQGASLGADWVLCVDCDEFIDPRGCGGDLRGLLAAVPATVLALHIETIDYQMTSADDRSEVIVPRRQRYRCLSPGYIGHVFPRACLAAQGAQVAMGNHWVGVHGRPVETATMPQLRLAHYPARSGWQYFAKALVGRMKVLAAGQAEVKAGTAVHYGGLIENLWTHPEWLFVDQSFLHGRAPEWVEGGVVEDPIAYLGGKLRYTEAEDAPHQALRSAVSYALHLAERHGELLDALPEARSLSDQKDSAYQQVL